MSGEVREFPPRPLIPMTVAFPCGLIGGVLAVLLPTMHTFLNGAQAGFGRWGLLAAAILGVAAFYVWRGRMRGLYRTVFLLVSCGIALGLASSSLWCSARERESQALNGVTASKLTFKLLDDPSISDSGYSFPADAYLDGCRIAKVRLVLTADVPVGATVAVIGRMTRFEDDQWGRSRFAHGEVRRVKAVKTLNVESPATTRPILCFRNALLDALRPAEDSARALVAGVSMGRSSEVNGSDVGETFSRVGLSHLVAVSGSHLALVGFLAETCLARLGASRRSRSIGMGICCVAFVLFTGISASAVRSCLMLLAGMLARGGGRRVHGISSLTVAASIFILINPAVIFDLGFQLSCASVTAILLFGDWCAYALEVLKVPRGVASVLAITLVSQVASFPLTASTFGTFSLVAPLSNAVVGPIVSFMLAASVVCLPLTLLPLVGPFALAVPLMSARAALFTAGLCARFPLASITVADSGPMMFAPWLGLALLYAVWPRPHARGIALCAVGCICVLGVPYVYWDRFAPASVTVLDVGQADCILVREGSSTLLVDAGVDSRALDALVHNNVHHLDAVVVTHWDEDHWGGLPDILDAVPVGRVIVAAGAAEQAPVEVDSKVDIEEVTAGDRVAVNGFSGRVVWPQQVVDGLDNDDSLCIDLSYASGGRELTMLLTGDAELDQERIFASEVGDIDVLKCGHHGSKKSVDRGLVHTLTPEVVIASAGEGNRYGHPSNECRQAVEDSGARFLCTIDHGDIRIEPSKNGIKITTQK